MDPLAARFGRLKRRNMRSRKPPSSVFYCASGVLKCQSFAVELAMSSITPLIQHAMAQVIVAPSILAADFSRLADEIHRVEAAGADWIHCDIMDGHFVDNISFGPDVVSLVRKETKLPLDVHLMIEHAEHYVPRFVKAGANSITVHVEPEAKHNVIETLQHIRDSGCRAGLTLNPATPIESVERFPWQLRYAARDDCASRVRRTTVPRRSDEKGQTRSGMEPLNGAQD